MDVRFDRKVLFQGILGDTKTLEQKILSMVKASRDRSYVIIIHCPHFPDGFIPKPQVKQNMILSVASRQKMKVCMDDRDQECHG